MSALQRDSRSDEGSSAFDMWRDYMHLSRILEQLCLRSEAERAPVIRRAPREPRRREDAKLSVGSGSVSSLSDSTGGAAAADRDHCHFCQRNGESPRVYLSHRLKTEDGSKVTCPILRRYRCPACHATGDQAHTLSYCPLPFGKAAGQRLPAFW